MDIIDVAAGLVFRRGKLLITKRPMKSHLGGLWEFPGGKREPEETFEGCLVRELREELGIEIAVDRLVEAIHHEYPEKTVLLKFFRCRWAANEPRAIGCPDFRWVEPAEIAAFRFPPADARLLKRLTSEQDLWREG